MSFYPTTIKILGLNFKEQLCSDTHTLVRVKDLSSSDICPALGPNLHYFSALGLCIRMIITALTQRMLELDVKVLQCDGSTTVINKVAIQSIQIINTRRRI